MLAFILCLGFDARIVMQEFYYSDSAGKAQGPHNVAEIRDLLRDKIISPTSYIWRPGDPTWLPLEKISEYKEISAEAPSCDHENTVIAKALKEVPHSTDATPQIVLGN